ncbi:hypothetical protein PTT_19994 [Pyrenophora teres f. teres 0-1]|uniref:Rhodopsin domain-containing protein n=1 Tax=Pyrenophora teres f. teres (strain 0-1) TaxID=861557 RepID=E3SA73_PYRTT|nr:hypothetical protein PTT_19994 [Pyrenophora teres f. teres 0-1]
METTLAIEVPLMVLAFCTVVLRVYARLAVKRKLALDDILITLGTAAALARTVISCMSANDDWGYDRKGPDLVSEIPYYQHIFTRRLFYLFAATLTRLSILTYYLRIFPPSLSFLRPLSYILILLSLLHFIQVLIVLSLFCKDIALLWSPHWRSFHGSSCFSSLVYSYSAAIGDSVVDSLIFALPLPYVWQLSKLGLKKRLGLVLVFGLGFVVCVVALLQIPVLRRREEDRGYFGGKVNVLVAVQICFGIVAASLPDLRGCVARVRFGKSGWGRGGDGGGSGGRAEVRDIERGLSHDGEMSGGKKGVRKPDWMRTDIPASLMSTTTITLHEGTRLSGVDSRDLVARPENAAVK